MPVVIAVRFPHGRYHANGWDTAPNSGDVEWPPSPWRLARALLAVWHTRVDTVSDVDLAGVLDLMRQPPAYWLPPVTTEHTRHYLPGAGYRTWDEKRDTSMTLDAAVWVGDRPIVIRWEHDVDAATRAALGRLVESLPYLGRAESVCEAAVLDEAEVSALELDDAGWCVPRPAGEHRVLCPTAEATREQLEVRPDEMRQAKLLRPLGSRWVPYERPVRAPDERGLSSPGPVSASRVDVVRWRLDDTVPFMAQSGLLATEALRAGRVKAIEEVSNGTPDPVLTGHLPREHGSSGRPVAFARHRSAHWLWLEGDSTGGDVFTWHTSSTRGEVVAPTRRVVRDVAVWIPGGVDQETALGLVRGFRGHSGLFRPRGYQPQGYVPAGLHLVASGSAAEALPELTGVGVTEWVSATPYLATRHRRRSQSPEEFVADDVRREWSRRGFLDGVEVTDVRLTDDRYPARWAAQYRRQRWLLPKGAAAARGVSDPAFQTMVRLRVAPGCTGPVSLGALSHFGFGLFLPVRA